MLFGKEKVELDLKMVALKRNELNLSRGKKKTNKMEHIDLLKYLLDITNDANLGMSLQWEMRYFNNYCHYYRTCYLGYHVKSVS